MFINFIKNFILQLKSDYETRPLVLFFEGFGTLSSLSAAFTLSILGKEANLIFVLLAYTIGSCCWLISGKLRKNSFNMILSSGYIIINVTGLIKMIF